LNPNSKHVWPIAMQIPVTVLLQNMKILLILLCLVVVNGCTTTPKDEQLFSGGRSSSIGKSQGSCDEAIQELERFSAEVAGEGLNPARITVFNWNMYKGQKAGWTRDLFKHSVNSDILLLQEAAFGGSLLDILDLKGLFWSFNNAFQYKGVGTGVLTASKIKPRASCGTRKAEPLIGLPKTALLSYFPLRGSREQLLVVNIHGINFTTGITAYEEQFNEIRNILRGHSGPLLVAGDLNNWTEKRRGVVDLLVEDLGLTILTFEDDSRSRFFGDPIDHILYRGVLPVAETSFEVISSDHNPIGVTFKMDDKPSSGE
jgi:endonuclease/exonuclease/phosphatase (EEP) superfamily protein YafD